jgi:hypothetical protein
VAEGLAVVLEGFDDGLGLLDEGFAFLVGVMRERGREGEAEEAAEEQREQECDDLFWSHVYLLLSGLEEGGYMGR